MARRFHFRLDPVLRQRKRVEEDCLRDFAEAQAQVFEQQNSLEAMAADKAALQGEIVELYRKKSDLADVLDRYRYINVLNLRGAYGQQDLARLNQALDSEREKLMEARKNRRALELLRERREEEHRKEVEAEEARLTDELAVQRFRVRKTGTGI